MKYKIKKSRDWSFICTHAHVLFASAFLQRVCNRVNENIGNVVEFVADVVLKVHRKTTLHSSFLFSYLFPCYSLFYLFFANIFLSLYHILPFVCSVLFGLAPISRSLLIVLVSCS